MTKITLRQVVKAVQQLGGRRGVRPRAVVESLVDKIHLENIACALDTAVRKGNLQRIGQRYKLPRGRRRKSRVYRKKATHRKHNIYSDRLQGITYLGRRTLFKTKQPNILTRSSTQSSNKSSSLRLSEQSFGSRRESKGSETDTRKSSDSGFNSSANSRLAQARDSVELLKERLSQSSKQGMFSPSTSLFSLFHW